jgi:cyclase
MLDSPRLALLLAAGTLFAAGLAFARPQGGDVAIQVRPVAGPVSLLEGKGGNIGVSAGPDGVWMIDCQYADMAPKIQAALAGLSKEPLRFVLNTHWHGDHTGGNEVFAAFAPIVAHANVRERMSRTSTRGGRTQLPAPTRAQPGVTFEHGVRMYANGDEIEVRHVGPAHTDGDSIVWFKQSNVVHLGDTFFNGRFPFVDLDSGGSVRGLSAVVEGLLKELPKDARLIPGHGPLGSVEDLANYHAMLVDVQALVAGALAAGKDAQAMKQEQLLAKYASWNWSFIDADSFIDTLVRDAQAR